MEPEPPAPGPSSRWRFLVVVLVPVVAAWDAGRALLRAWGEFGMRMLEKLDPLFARLTAVMVRLERRLQPFFDRVRRVAEHVATRMRPTVDRVGRLTRAVADAVGRVTAALGRWFAPAVAAFRRARRLVGTPFRFVGRLIVRGAQAARRWCRARWRTAGEWIRSLMPARPEAPEGD